MEQYKLLEKYIQIESLSIVLIGEFNPLIFQPFWLVSKQLIRENEGVNAEVEIMHPEIVRYEIADWLFFEVTRNRCEFRTAKKPYFEPLKDLVCGVFEVLAETPIKTVGINCVYDLSLKDDREYYKFGSALAGLKLFESNLADPRLLQIEVREQSRAGIQGGSRRVRITPSDQLMKVSRGVNVNINNHFDIMNPAIVLGAGGAIEVLNTSWDNSIEESKKIVNDLLIDIKL